MGDAQDMDTVDGSKSTDLQDEKIDITLKHWKYKQFRMSDIEMKEALTTGILPSGAEAAFDASAPHALPPHHSGTFSQPGNDPISIL